jgi:hypothetical protein
LIYAFYGRKHSRLRAAAQGPSRFER